MRRAFLLATPIALFIAVPGAAWWRLVPHDDPRPLPAGLIDLGSEEGAARLAGAEAATDYNPLDRHYERQALTSFCGVASSVTVLGALDLPATQRGFFTDAASAVRPAWRVVLTGMTLDDLGGLIEAHGATTEIHHAADFDADAFRATVTRNLSAEGDYIVVNYQRGALGQEATGHISPLAAYDADTDSVLVMDTASYKYPRTWVPLAALYGAMNTVDSETGLTRGYVEVSAP